MGKMRLLLILLTSTAQAGIAYEPAAAQSAATSQETPAAAAPAEAAPTVTAEAAAAAVTDLPPAPFSITYKVSWMLLSGDVTLTLAENAAPGSYKLTAATQARGLARLGAPDPSVEEAYFVLADNAMLSQSYELIDGSESGENDTEIRFDWDAGVAASRYEQEEANLTLSDNVYDRITADIVIIGDLRNGREPRTLRIAEKNQIRDYTFTPQGREQVKVPAGTFDTVKYLRQRPGSSRSTMIWYAPEIGYLPVRMEQLKRGKTNVTSVATDITL